MYNAHFVKNMLYSSICQNMLKLHGYKFVLILEQPMAIKIP